MKKSVDTDEKNKDAVCVRTDYLCDKFDNVKSDWEEINRELKELSKEKHLDDSKIQALQNQQNKDAIEEQALQNKMKIFWKGNMDPLVNNQLVMMQRGYKAIDDMYTNNPATRR
jgi:uncharacterized protein HemY